MSNHTVLVAVGNKASSVGKRHSRPLKSPAGTDAWTAPESTSARDTHPSVDVTGARRGRDDLACSAVGGDEKGTRLVLHMPTWA